MRWIHVRISYRRAQEYRDFWEVLMNPLPCIADLCSRGLADNASPLITLIQKLERRLRTVVTIKYYEAVL